MSFPRFLRAFALFTLTALVALLLMVAYLHNIPFLLMMALLLAAFVLSIALYSLAFALEKLDYINSHAQTLSKAALSYLCQHPYQDPEEDSTGS